MTAMEEEMEALRKENARLRKENLFLNLMSQDVFEKVTEKLEMKRSGLRQEFDDKFNYHRFSVLHSDLYYEYIAEYHLYDTHRDFHQEDWEYFWTDYDELVYRNGFAEVEWQDVFAEQSDRCRQCGGINGCACGDYWREASL